MTTIRRRRVLLSAQGAGLIGASTALIGGGSILVVIELLWIIACVVIARVRARAALHLMWWGAIGQFVTGFVIVAAIQVGQMGTYDHGSAGATREAAELDAVAHCWTPYLLAALVVWLGATVAWIADQLEAAPARDGVPVARAVR